MNNQRNLILAVVLSGALLFGWDFAMGRIYPEPVVTEQSAAAQPVTAAGVAGGPAIAAADMVQDLDEALASEGRVKIDAPEVAGSINLTGARIDDIVLKTHRQSVEKDSGPVRLFAPAGTENQQFAQFGWVGEGVSLPDATTVWTSDGGTLTQATPVSLTYDNEEGLAFSLTYSIDDRYMISVDQTVINNSEGSLAVRPYAFVNRSSLSADTDTWNIQVGPISAHEEALDFGWDYDDVSEQGVVDLAGQTSWIGFTDIYWLSALIPQDDQATTSAYRHVSGDNFRADIIYEPVTIAAGQQVSRTTRLFAGAKESDVLDQYEAEGVDKFGLAIDWGWFRWFMKPIFWLLKSLFSAVGNFGVAIILMTVIIRLILFPIAQKQFASMAQMRAVQPKMKALQARYKDDKPQLQQEMAKLYKEEKVNPLSGCLPIFLQIPIFFALYKVLRIAIEMRHEPFFLWIKDLSAPDPATVLNLFGLLPFDPPSFLAIGVLAVLLGLTMWLQFKLNPATMDPMQQQIFMIMPWMLMFVMAPFAAGLLLYWITSNILTLAQQKYLYSKHPQLKAQAAKEAEDKARAAERDKDVE